MLHPEPAAETAADLAAAWIDHPEPGTPRERFEVFADAVLGAELTEVVQRALGEVGAEEVPIPDADFIELLERADEEKRDGHSVVQLHTAIYFHTLRRLESRGVSFAPAP